MPPFGSRIGSIEKADPLIDVFRNRDALTGEPLSGQWRDRSGHPEVELPLESGCFVSLLQLAHDLAAALAPDPAIEREGDKRPAVLRPGYNQAVDERDVLDRELSCAGFRGSAGPDGCAGTRAPGCGA